MDQSAHRAQTQRLLGNGNGAVRSDSLLLVLRRNGGCELVGIFPNHVARIDERAKAMYRWRHR
jgi:hypothetical protein